MKVVEKLVGGCAERGGGYAERDGDVEAWRYELLDLSRFDMCVVTWRCRLLDLCKCAAGVRCRGM